MKPQQGIMSLARPRVSAQDSQAVDQILGNTTQMLGKLDNKTLGLLLQLTQYLKAHKSKYKELMANLEAKGSLPPGVFPDNYDPKFLSVFALSVAKAQQAKGGMAGGGIADIAQSMKNQGRGKDTMLAHINPEEADLLEKRGGVNTINPVTGLPEFGIFDDIGNALSGVGNAVGSVLKPVGDLIGGVLSSPLGLAATAAAAYYFMGPSAGALIPSVAEAAIPGEVAGIGAAAHLTPAAIESGIGSAGYGFNQSAAASGLFDPSVIGSGAAIGAPSTTDKLLSANLLKNVKLSSGEEEPASDPNALIKMLMMFEMMNNKQSQPGNAVVPALAENTSNLPYDAPKKPAYPQTRAAEGGLMTKHLGIGGLSANRTQTDYAKNYLRGSGYRPGQGGITYFTPMKYGPNVPAPSLPVEPNPTPVDELVKQTIGKPGGGGMDSDSRAAMLADTAKRMDAWEASDPEGYKNRNNWIGQLFNGSLIAQLAKLAGQGIDTVKQTWADNRLKALGIDPKIAIANQNQLSGLSMQQALNSLGQASAAVGNYSDVGGYTPGTPEAKAAAAGVLGDAYGPGTPGFSADRLAAANDQSAGPNMYSGSNLGPQQMINTNPYFSTQLGPGTIAPVISSTKELSLGDTKTYVANETRYFSGVDGKPITKEKALKELAEGKNPITIRANDPLATETQAVQPTTYNPSELAGIAALNAAPVDAFDFGPTAGALEAEKARQTEEQKDRIESLLGVDPYAKFDQLNFDQTAPAARAEIAAQTEAQKDRIRAIAADLGYSPMVDPYSKQAIDPQKYVDNLNQQIDKQEKAFELAIQSNEPLGELAANNFQNEAERLRTERENFLAGSVEDQYKALANEQSAANLMGADVETFAPVETTPKSEEEQKKELDKIIQSFLSDTPSSLLGPATLLAGTDYTGGIPSTTIGDYSFGRKPIGPDTSGLNLGSLDSNQLKETFPGAFNPFEASLAVTVYGPDGTEYGSPAQAMANGVTNYSMSPPADPSARTYYDNSLAGDKGFAATGGFGNSWRSADGTPIRTADGFALQTGQGAAQESSNDRVNRIVREATIAAIGDERGPNTPPPGTTLPGTTPVAEPTFSDALMNAFSNIPTFAPVNIRDAYASLGDGTTSDAGSSTSNDNGSYSGSFGNVQAPGEAGRGTAPAPSPPSDSGNYSNEGRNAPAPAPAPSPPSNDNYSNEGRNSESGGGGGGGGGRVICTHFYRKGEMSREMWRSDLEFTFKNLSPTTVRGYQYWAIPYVKLMRKSKLAENIMRPLAMHRAQELSYQMGRSAKGSLFGKVVRLIGEPICFTVGLFVGEQNWQSLWTPAKD